MRSLGRVQRQQRGRYWRARAIHRHVCLEGTLHEVWEWLETSALSEPLSLKAKVWLKMPHTFGENSFYK